MIATSLTAAVVGVDAHLVRVEADTAGGFPRFTMVGLPDSAVRESESRIRAALRNCGFAFGWDRRITVNLAPASLRKVGSSFDLATAIGLLAADGVLPRERLTDVLLVGELALGGALRPVAGVLPMLLLARRKGLRAAIVPHGNVAEATLVSGVAVHGAASLPEALTIAASDPRPPGASPSVAPHQPDTAADLADVRGLVAGRRALEIAAAGGHNLLLVGPPGSGKTMLARRLPGILPSLTEEEAIETTAIHSAHGSPIGALINRRPFRSPHHTASSAALVGGGGLPRPGEVSLAHNGVLFLDEVVEFPRRALEALRQPLEEGMVTVARVRGTLEMPARFQLIAAMNPCPCGALGDPRRACRCTGRQVAAYQGRLSGPLLDRIDLVVEAPPLSYSELTGPPGEASATVARRVLAAREIQGDRGRALDLAPSVALNARLDGRARRRAVILTGEAAEVLSSAVDRLGLSARGYDRVLRVARTVADLEGSDRLRPEDVAEALYFRLPWSDPEVRKTDTNPWINPLTRPRAVC